MNHLAFGNLLVDHLRACVHSVNDVLLTVPMSGISDVFLVTPALHVSHVSDEVGMSAGRGFLSETKQVWAITIVTKNLASPSPRQVELGQIITEVLHALQGWAANGHYTWMYRESAPEPTYDGAGFSFYPLHFSTKYLTVGFTNDYANH